MNAAGPQQANLNAVPFQPSTAKTQLQINSTNPFSVTTDPDSGTSVPIQAMHFRGGTSLPSIILTLDPRAQFSLDLINEDVGKVDSVN